MSEFGGEDDAPVRSHGDMMKRQGLFSALRLQRSEMRRMRDETFLIRVASGVAAGQGRAGIWSETMIRLTIILAILAVTTPAYAAGEPPSPVIFAECREGGCSCTESPLSVPEMELVLDAEAPAGMEQLIVVSYPDGDILWSHVSIIDLETMFGGDGECSTEAPLQPADGVWSSHSRFVSISCGAATATLRAFTEPHLNDEVAPRVVWGGVFDGAIYQSAWMAANPDPEHVVAPSRQTSPTISEASVTYASDGGTLLTTYRFELLSPGLFRADWHMSTKMDGVDCRWHIRSRVRKISD